MRLFLLLSYLFLVAIDLEAHGFPDIFLEILEFNLVNISFTIRGLGNNMWILLHWRHIWGRIEEGHLSVLIRKLVVSCLIDDMVDSFSIVRWLTLLESGLSW